MKMSGDHKNGRHTPNVCDLSAEKQWNKATVENTKSIIGKVAVAKRIQRMNVPRSNPYFEWEMSAYISFFASFSSGFSINFLLFVNETILLMKWICVRFFLLLLEIRLKHNFEYQMKLGKMLQHIFVGKNYSNLIYSLCFVPSILPCFISAPFMIVAREFKQENVSNLVRMCFQSKCIWFSAVTFNVLMCCGHKSNEIKKPSQFNLTAHF